MITKELLEKSLKNILLIIITIGVVLICSLYKVPDDDETYINNDATWHTLLTIKAYSETSPKIHKYLPIVTLGAPENKSISWGATVPDKYGNYYYTSFSPAGYYLPYKFIQLFRLPVTEKSLFIFNMFLLCLSSIILVFFIKEIFKSSKNKYLLSIIGIIVYNTMPEILHGMGASYWHQSILQVTLLLQIYCYYLKEHSKISKILFYFLCLINPYIEWTGYVANIGFIIAEFFKKESNKKQQNKFLYSVLILTCMSGAIFCFHYLQNISLSTFLETSSNRFEARNFTQLSCFIQLIYGYFVSYKMYWVLLLVLFIIPKDNNKSFLFSNKPLLICLLFPLIENLIMVAHAVYYPYDQMKLAFFLVILLCDFLNRVLEIANNKTKIYLILLLSIIVYTNVLLFRIEGYFKQVPYFNYNNILSSYLKSNYSIKNSVLYTNSVVRGYFTLLFNRNIYESTNFNNLKTHIAVDNIIYIHAADCKVLEIPNLDYAIIYNKKLNSYTLIKVINSKIVKLKMPLDMINTIISANKQENKL